jgi:hypothetical protein
VIKGKKFAVSKLITIEQFRQFMLQKNELYARYRPKPPEQDDWERCNQADDIATAPASVTWYDAMAYTTDISKVMDIPVRLASEGEWLEIACDLRKDVIQNPNETTQRSKVKIVTRTETDQQSGFWGTKYLCDAADLQLHKTSDDVCFLRAADFGEWLAPKGAVINSLHLGAMNMTPVHIDNGHNEQSPENPEAKTIWDERMSAERDYLSPSCNGAYKNMRFGFRIIYEISER